MIFFTKEETPWKKQNIPAKNNAAGKRRPWMPVILILLVLAFISSSILGYVLGRNTGTPPLGQIIDTIVLEPEESDTQAVLHLAGRIVYPDGTPAAGRTLELHSDPLTAVSSSNGGFLFENVPKENILFLFLIPTGQRRPSVKSILSGDTAAKKRFYPAAGS